jgi:uncharacterized OB-fold protein
MSAARPLPEEFGPDAAEFWEGARLGEFRVLRCDRCDAVIWYPRAHCPTCGSREVTWSVRPAPVTGVIYTFTVVRKHTHPFFAPRTPFVVAWVDVDDGPRLLTEVAGVDVDQVRVGDRVVLRWEEHESVKLPTFVPEVAV